ncbi:hypothetical protein H7I53_18075 [Mycolicibacterium pulveris]|uniref:Uncharacterized protein n=1 Tax=Mycolicibacterium pulveris TaxID=36813 RepID=A0A7I7UDC1_MYCPV|nr:hypothetical protein [Mycolicibacterium pulveris]MCV6982123.1 hypothetical protein [Mycolicibacterium pulveris]BBY78923.1 hypothetical protein MPUL_00810 [Mycolicibacterium pulveris]
MGERRLCDVRGAVCRPICPDCEAALSVIADELNTCDVEIPGHCSLIPDDKRHFCEGDDGHDGAHECACGHRWKDDDDD